MRLLRERLTVDGGDLLLGEDSNDINGEFSSPKTVDLRLLRERLNADGGDWSAMLLLIVAKAGIRYNIADDRRLCATTVVV